ncbi:MAG: BolA/IbaG family iron-sulfur metabolism protein [Cellvibrionaceae bacterium]|nr:BolA/IbaG family iron-sulfur metabolism protein [Cellvibrionaceae bacterium]
MLVQQRIEEKLQRALMPDYLQVINDSHKHNVPPNSESHFTLIVVAAAFDGVSPVRRQQRVYEVLRQELSEGVHALSMQTFSPAQWQADATVHSSPPCLGGE